MIIKMKEKKFYITTGNHSVSFSIKSKCPDSRRVASEQISTPQHISKRLYPAFNAFDFPINFWFSNNTFSLKWCCYCVHYPFQQCTCVLREATPATKTWFLNVLNQELVFFRSSRSFIYSIFYHNKVPSPSSLTSKDSRTSSAAQKKAFFCHRLKLFPTVFFSSNSTKPTKTKTSPSSLSSCSGPVLANRFWLEKRKKVCASLNFSVKDEKQPFPVCCFLFFPARSKNLKCSLYVASNVHRAREHGCYEKKKPHQLLQLRI